MISFFSLVVSSSKTTSLKLGVLFCEFSDHGMTVFPAWTSEECFLVSSSFKLSELISLFNPVILVSRSLILLRAVSFCDDFCFSDSVSLLISSGIFALRKLISLFNPVISASRSWILLWVVSEHVCTACPFWTIDEFIFLDSFNFDLRSWIVRFMEQKLLCSISTNPLSSTSAPQLSQCQNDIWYSFDSQLPISISKITSSRKILAVKKCFANICIEMNSMKIILWTWDFRHKKTNGLGGFIFKGIYAERS